MRQKLADKLIDLFVGLIAGLILLGSAPVWWHPLIRALGNSATSSAAKPESPETPNSSASSYYTSPPAQHAIKQPTISATSPVQRSLISKSTRTHGGQAPQTRSISNPVVAYTAGGYCDTVGQKDELSDGYLYSCSTSHRWTKVAHPKPKLTLVQCGRGGSMGTVGINVSAEVSYSAYHLPGTLILEVGDSSTTEALEAGVTGAAYDAPFANPVTCSATITTSGGSESVSGMSD